MLNTVLISIAEHILKVPECYDDKLSCDEYAQGPTTKWQGIDFNQIF